MRWSELIIIWYALVDLHWGLKYWNVFISVSKEKFSHHWDYNIYAAITYLWPWRWWWTREGCQHRSQWLQQLLSGLGDDSAGVCSVFTLLEQRLSIYGEVIHIVLIWFELGHHLARKQLHQLRSQQFIKISKQFGNFSNILVNHFLHNKSLMNILGCSSFSK